MKGHQIIGELRPAKSRGETSGILKGHQIIGELRLRGDSQVSRARRLKGHQIIGELRPMDNLFKITSEN